MQHVRNFIVFIDLIFVLLPNIANSNTCFHRRHFINGSDTMEPETCSTSSCLTVIRSLLSSGDYDISSSCGLEWYDSLSFNQISLMPGSCHTIYPSEAYDRPELYCSCTGDLCNNEKYVQDKLTEFHLIIESNKKEISQRIKNVTCSRCQIYPSKKYDSNSKCDTCEGPLCRIVKFQNNDLVSNCGKNILAVGCTPLGSNAWACVCDTSMCNDPKLAANIFPVTTTSTTTQAITTTTFSTTPEILTTANSATSTTTNPITQFSIPASTTTSTTTHAITSTTFPTTIVPDILTIANYATSTTNQVTYFSIPTSTSTAIIPSLPSTIQTTVQSETAATSPTSLSTTIVPHGITKEIEIEKVKAYSILFIFFTLCVTILFLSRKYKKKQNVRRNLKDNEVIQMDSLNNYSFSELTKPLQNELRDLPHVSKECINVVNKIGQGSFGDVYRGDAWNLPNIGSKRVQVAIKMLKEGNSIEDQKKFVKEAILMNNFNHPNIVKLLGVCLESDPYILLIELMEGGDLLNFLRSCRPMDAAPSQLSLNEIFLIMIDVGRGCAYLEKKKHVHRDLAARNCLITSQSSSTRITKIADFGLARNMYIDEYYRMKREDFLPLKWLALESAMDGVFTTKSDVWAYGVLCWEALTLGKQPYETKLNSMILPFLRSGGRLEAPNECPPELYKIMGSCWEENPEKRPSFSKLLEMIEILHRNNPKMMSNNPFPSRPSGFVNHRIDASEGSNISQHYQHQRGQTTNLHGSGSFDKLKNSGIPSHLQPRNIPSNVFLSENLISAQTKATKMEDNITFSDEYEIPRNNNQTTPLSSIISAIPENNQSTNSKNS